MRYSLLTLSLFSVLFFVSCLDHNPNLDKSGEDELKSLELDYDLESDSMQLRQVIYVPIYSDIYLDEQTQKSLLAATLSIRNTSFTDSLFISKIDYFNTEGDLVRSYIDGPISLTPMASVNYVIEKKDDTGGAGANFIVELSARNKSVKPLIQAVMIGESGNKGFSFSTDGYLVGG